MVIKKAYRKGYVFERELKQKLEKEGWKVIRSAGSKKPDLIAAKKGKIIIIECKVTDSKTIYLQEEEVENMKGVSKEFNAEAIYAVKHKKDTILISIEELIKKGKMYQYDLEE